MSKGFDAFGTSERIGKRATMEDALLTVAHLEKVKPCDNLLKLGSLNNPEVFDRSLPKDVKSNEKVVGIFGVFDGHGGSLASEFCSQVLPHLLLQQEEKYSNQGVALSNALRTADRLLAIYLDEQYADSREHGSGSTACTVAIEYSTGSKEMKVTCANIGDSRCILLNKDGSAKPLSRDHRPLDVEEASRIRKRNGVINNGRVMSALAVSRALGDFAFKKPHVSAWSTPGNTVSEDLIINTPDITEYVVTSGDSIIVIACDGIWDVFSNEEVASYVLEKQQMLDEKLKTSSTAKKCEIIAEGLTDAAIKRGSADNCSAIVISLAPNSGSSACTIS